MVKNATGTFWSSPRRRNFSLNVATRSEKFIFRYVGICFRNNVAAVEAQCRTVPVAQKEARQAPGPRICRRFGAILVEKAATSRARRKSGVKEAVIGGRGTIWRLWKFPLILVTASSKKLSTGRHTATIAPICCGDWCNKDPFAKVNLFLILQHLIR